MKKKIIFLTLGLLIILLVGCTSRQVGGIQEQTPTENEQLSNTLNIPDTGLPDNSAKENPNKNVEDGKIGTAYKITYLSTEYEITLKEAKFESSDNPYFDKTYVLAFFEIKNIGQDTDFFTPTIYAEDSEREKISRTFAVVLNGDYDKILSFIEQLNPGQKTSGWVAFEVPEDLTKIYVFFEYSNPFINKLPQYIKYEINKEVTTPN